MEFFEIRDDLFCVWDDLTLNESFVRDGKIVADITYTEEIGGDDEFSGRSPVDGSSSSVPPPKPLEWRLLVVKRDVPDSESAMVAYRFPYLLEKGEFMQPACPYCQYAMCTRVLFEGCRAEPLVRHEIMKVFEGKEFRETITFKGYKFFCDTLFSDKYSHIWSKRQAELYHPF